MANVVYKCIQNLSLFVCLQSKFTVQIQYKHIKILKKWQNVVNQLAGYIA